MTSRTAFQPGRAFYWPIVVLIGVAALSSAVEAGPKHRIPDVSVLKARVAELYRAQEAKDEQAVNALVLPQILECHLIRPDDPDRVSGDEESVQLISWKIKDIQFDMHYFEGLKELCSGQPVHATAGALVFIKSTYREQGGDPTTDIVVQPWLYVDATWYWLIDVD